MSGLSMEGDCLHSEKGKREMERRLRFFAVVLCVALLCAVPAGCAAETFLDEVPREFGLRQESGEPSSKDNDIRVVSLEDMLAVPEYGGDGTVEAEESFLMEEACSFARSSLRQEEQSWYDDMEQALGSFREKIQLNKASLERLDASEVDEAVDRIFRCVLGDHPEIFYVDGYSCTKYMQGDKIVSVEFSGSYTMDQEAALGYRDAIEESAQAILAGIERDSGDYEKVKYVYETIVCGTDYDLEASDNQNIYSVFVNHRSVCQGYAKATQYLLNRLGVECTLVLGTVDTGEGHAWNLVKVDGDYYYVDTTWGDVSYQVDEQPSGETGQEGAQEAAGSEEPGGFGNDGPDAPADMDSETGEDPAEDPEREESGNLSMPEINYDYLNVTTEELLRTHSIGGAVPMPLCTATRANYYVVEGAYFTSYDKEQMAALFQRASEEGKGDVNVKCADVECYQVIFQALIQNKEIFGYLSDREGGIAYAQNEKQLSLTFWVTNE